MEKENSALPAEHPKCDWFRYLHDGGAYQEVCNRPATVGFVLNQGRTGEFTQYRCDEHAEDFRHRHAGWNVPELRVPEGA